MTATATRPWLACCVCGWGAHYAGELSAENAATWHRETASANQDHVTSVEYHPPTGRGRR